MDNEVGQLDEESRDLLVDKCYQVVREDDDGQDHSDLQHVFGQASSSLGPRATARLGNLVSRLSELSENGVLARPGEFLKFIQMLSERDTDRGLSSRLHNLGIHPIPTNVGSSSLENDSASGEGPRIGDILRQLHSQEGQTPNKALLKDLPYALQGIKTQYYSWDVNESGRSMLTYPTKVRWPTIGLLNQLLEPALLYRELVEFTEKTQDACLTMQALQSAISEELRNYLVLVGVVENQVRLQPGDPDSRSQGELTLQRSLVLLQEATLGLRLLFSISEASKGLKGGQIISVVREFCNNGAEFVAKFAKRLLEKVSYPFYNILNGWMARGILTDPHKEFFVQIKDAGSPWSGRFAFEQELVPSILTPEVAKSVFDTGKTLYFVREVCNEHAWVDERENASIVNYEDLDHRVAQNYKEVVKYLNGILVERFHMDLHLQALKDYLLLGKGDFVQVLVEIAAPVLSKPASKLLRHHLTSILETALRGSSAQSDSPEVLKYLDARMLELGHGDIGWDIFTLDYRAESPLDIVILDRSAATEYLRVFNFLWRIKRISYEFNTGWRRLATAYRSFLSKFNTRRAEWDLARSTYQEMIHFVGELQYYVSYEVIEVSWANLKHQLSQGGGQLTVDDIISAHRKYLSEITQKGLLGGGALMGELHETLKVALAFRETIDALYELSVRMHALGTARPSDEERFDSVHNRIQHLKAMFEKSVQRLAYNLTKLDNGEMRFLGVRLDFNGFYSRARVKERERREANE